MAKKENKMYTELSKTAEAVGKTVQSITYPTLSDQMILAFSDGTFVAFGVEHGEYVDDAVRRKLLDLENFGAVKLFASGIVTKEEHQQKMVELREVWHRGKERAERRQYQRLKAKYGGEGSDDP